MMKNHYSTISEYLVDMGHPPPENPLFAVVSINADISDEQLACPDIEQSTSTNFYAISFKNIIEGDIFYGKTQYDCKNGAMLFLAPNQVFSTRGIKIKTEGHVILIHEDYLAGHQLGQEMKSCNFFDYAVNEALHLSPKEERLVLDIFERVKQECHAGYDEYSREIILSYVKTLLSYGERFYKRQFIQRNEVNESLFAKFTLQLESHYASSEQIALPALADIADKMRLSSRYLSDAIKTETGKSAKECMQLFIMEKAKASLVNTQDSVTTIAYTLGFDSPQYFVRLFKKKTGMTPTEFRNSIH